MCDPSSIAMALMVAGTAASGASTYNQSKSANRNLKHVYSEKNKAFSESMDRQQGYADEASGQFSSNVQDQSAAGFNDKLTDAIDNRSQAFNNNMSVVPGDYVTPNSAPNNVKLAMEQAFGKADAATNNSNDALARLSGYGDAQIGANLDRSRFGRAFGNLSDKAGRDARLTGLDINQIGNNAFKPPSTSLSIAKQAGQFANQIGASMGGGGGGKSGETGKTKGSV